jgi:hypothetical protein
MVVLYHDTIGTTFLVIATIVGVVSISSIMRSGLSNTDLALKEREAGDNISATHSLMFNSPKVTTICLHTLFKRLYNNLEVI